MVDRPLLVDIDPTLWAAYRRTRPQSLARMRLRELLGSVESQVNIVYAEQGDTLVFVSSQRTDRPGDADVFGRALADLLPGVKTSVCLGVDTILHTKRQP
jgi:hypothetical protein